MITYNNLVAAFEAFVANHKMLTTFTHGDPTEVDIEKIESYPLMHLVYTGSSYDTNTKRYSVELYLLDVPGDDSDEAAHEREAVSDAEQIAEDILADLENGHQIFDSFKHRYEIGSASTSPLTDEGRNRMVGVLLDLEIVVPYRYDACNAPLVGVSPAGSADEVNNIVSGIRVREADGTPNVNNVSTLIVDNGSLTDEGGGIVTLELGAGSVSSVNGVSPDSSGNVVISTGSGTLDDLTDTNLTSLTAGDVLVYDSASGKFQNAAQSTLAAGSAASVTGAQASAITANTAKTSFPGFGTTAGTALEGDTALLQLGTTSSTALAGDTTTISGAQASAITANTAKTSFPGFGTTAGTALEGNTSLLQLGTTAGTALEGNTSIPADLDDLSDVEVTTPAAAQVLYYESSVFKNKDLLTAMQQALVDSGCTINFGTNSAGDFNGDGFIDVNDLLSFLTVYMTSVEPAGDCAVNRGAADRTPGGSSRTPTARMSSQVNNAPSTFIANFEYNNYDSTDDFQLATSKAISEQIDLRKTQGKTSTLSWSDYSTTQDVASGAHTILVPRMDETSTTITTRGSNFMQQNSIQNNVAVGGVSTQAGITYTATLTCRCATGVLVAFSTTVSGVFPAATGQNVFGDGTEQTVTLTSTVAQGYNDTGAANAGTLKISAVATGDATIKYKSLTITITN